MYADQEKRKEYQRKYSRANRARLSAYSKEYYHANKTTIKVQANSIRLSKVAELLAYTREIKERTPCADCGHKFHHIAMDFDHLPEHVKLFTISRMVQKTISMATLKAEIAKCEVVCACCHRVRTFNRKLAAKAARSARG